MNPLAIATGANIGQSALTGLVNLGLGTPEIIDKNNFVVTDNTEIEKQQNKEFQTIMIFIAVLFLIGVGGIFFAFSK